MFAIDDLSDAIDVTREFLTPVRPGTWLKLALIVFFVGGTGFGGQSFSGGGGGIGSETPPDTGTDPGTAVDFAEWLPILIAIALFFLVIGLGFLFVSSLLEFTLLETLRSGEVHVRRYTSRNVGRGAHLFGFRVALGLLALVLLGIPLIAIVLSGIAWELIGLFILFAIPVGIGFAVVDRLTTVFVAPTMLERDLGVVAAWKRIWPTLTSHWTEYVVYLLLVWVLQLVIGFATMLLLLVLLIPFLILFFILLLVPFLNLLLLLFVPVLVLLFVLFSALIQVPVVTYLRYYALLVLGDTDPELDLIPEQRAAVRDGGSDRTGGTGGGWDSDDDGPDGDDRGWDDESDQWGRDESQDDGWDDTGSRDDTDTRDDTDSRDDTDFRDTTDSSESDDDRDDRDDRGGW
ncbi:hypothetical protein HYG81_16640 [Natrinema zhouii]|uniref:Uncharacterized protein n=1 Tax=Natrinema zhouii TaxID=1710539 RepID=A0A7D6CPT6_9EURY|nr:hypothetical protein [Natrinema zhouii]QLK25689.1 hypothetical protein HYG81_16640 [Natrinema zhouii]